MSDDDDWTDRIGELIEQMEAEKIAKWERELQPLVDAGLDAVQIEAAIAFAVNRVNEVSRAASKAMEKMLTRLGYVQNADGKWIEKRLAD